MRAIDRFIRDNPPVQPSAFKSGGRYYQSLRLNGVWVEGLRDSEEVWKYINTDDIAGKSVLDLGCHVGMHSFGAIKRGAKYVMGLDIDGEAVNFARGINTYIGYDSVDFLVYDLNEFIGGEFDVIFCFSLDAHINNKDNLVKTLKQARHCIYLEGHDNRGVKDYMFIFKEFKSYELLGYCQSMKSNPVLTRPFYRIQV